VVIAVPSFAFLSVIEQIQSCYHQQKLVIATKGLSASSDFLFSAQVERILQTDAYAFLSGPSHAEEVIQRMSTWVTIASRQVSFAQEM
jgi:glycerol-3-phosphate dehydrogenase (NAD(P)+)